MQTAGDPGNASMNNSTRRTVRRAYTIVVVVGLLVLIYMARNALAPFLLAFLGIYFMLPVVNFIEERLPEEGRWERFRRPLAVLLTTLLMLIILGVVLYTLLKPLIEQTIDLFENFDTHWQTLREEYPDLVRWYENTIPENVRQRIEERGSEIGGALVPGAASVISWLAGVTGSLVSTVVAAISIPLFIIYYLLSEPKSTANMRQHIPAPWIDDAIAVFRIVDRIMGSYTRGVVLMSVIVGVITGGAYWAIGVDLWLPLGMIAFFGEIVPIIGPWIAFALTFPVILATQPNLAIPAVIVFALVQALEGWFLAPRIEGHAVKFTSAGTLLLLAIGGALAGALGVVFALPAAAILRALIVYGAHRIDGHSPDGALDMLPIFEEDEENEAEDSTDEDEAHTSTRQAPTGEPN